MAIKTKVFFVCREIKKDKVKGRNENKTPFWLDMGKSNSKTIKKSVSKKYGPLFWHVTFWASLQTFVFLGESCFFVRKSSP
jgi:hypothetical protein